jgi:hypothetical protein
METQRTGEAAVAIPHDRRVHLRLRAVFDSALALVAPFFDRNRIWSGVSLEYFAYRVLREHYPDLSAVDIHVFVAAARRVYAVRSPSTEAVRGFTPSPAHAREFPR